MQQHRFGLHGSISLALALILTLAPLQGTAVSRADTLPSEATVVSGGTPESRAVIEDALNRFARAGLDLPPVHFTIHPPDKRHCNGYRAYWAPGSHSDEIRLCFFDTFTVLHELAHSWESDALSDKTRQDFMELTNSHAWRSDEVKYNAQGIEAVANTVARILLAGDPYVNSSRHEDDLAAFEVLTGTSRLNWYVSAP